MTLGFLFAALATVLAEDIHTIKQEDRAFSQTEITVKPGDSLVFTNSDSVTHNVFSKSTANAFDIRVQKPGEATKIEFKQTGIRE
jgi:plastocyanin